MKEKYLSTAIMLIACAITSVINIIDGVEFFQGVVRLLITLIMFYIIGKIAVKIMMKAINYSKKPDNSEEESKVEESKPEEEKVSEDLANINEK